MIVTSLTINKRMGTYGEYRVISELISRGFIPYLPVTDEGIDLMLNNGVRIQVKTARLQKHKVYPNGVYKFSLRKAGGKGKGSIRDWTTVCDFFVLYGADEDRFFVYPATSNIGSMWVVPRNHQFKRTQVDIEMAKRLHAQGMSYPTIAREMNIAPLTAKSWVNGTRPTNADDVCRKVLQYEDRWDLLDKNPIAELVESATEVKDGTDTPSIHS